MKFKQGDIVRLNSGGPDMTVGSGDEETVECVYFHNGHIDTCTLPIAMVFSVEKPQAYRDKNTGETTWAAGPDEKLFR